MSKVTPTFFPHWLHGEAPGEERAVSSGLKAPGLLGEFGVYHEDAVVRDAPHLTAHEAVCLPCAGLIAWSALVDRSDIKAGYRRCFQSSAEFDHQTAGNSRQSKP